MKNTLIMLSIVSLLSCQTTPVKVAVATEERQVVKGLSEAHSLYRSQHVSNVHYDMDLDLMDSMPKLNSSKTLTHFNGKLVIEFDLDEAVPLTLDFNDGEFKSIIVNTKEVDPKTYNKIFLPLPASVLQKGRNQIVAIFRHEYSKNGSGLYKFTDPEDGLTYLYTDFEPFGANIMFPCFDQPDLKATYALKVRTPNDWQVITSNREEKINTGAYSKTWIFPKSQKFSTYIFSLHAGHYSMWSSSYTGTTTVPLRLFARKSLAKYVKPETWFTYTKSGMKYFESYFGYPYPFKKYDQVIVPDFNSGAMENVAAVTFSERFVQRSKSTEQELERLATTLLHELAHMWFGNLVTMKWWNDLWLNESFATFMATKAVVNLGTFKNPWQSFYSGSKGWAYWNDQLVTTHPIEDTVPSTEEAFTNFDGITYGKGAASLKQLVFFIGEQSFQEGLKVYFKNFAYANTKRTDFTSTLAVAAHTDLHAWSKEWLQTQGLNSVQVNYTCNVGKIDRFELIQMATESNPTLRTHKTLVALFKEIDGKIQTIKTQEVKIEGPSTQVSELVGQECPDIVYPNYNDHAYFKVNLDKNTLAKLPKLLSKIPDTLTRTMIWDTLWNMVRDAELPVTEYAQMALENLPNESDEKLLSSLLNALSSGDDSVQFFLPQQKEFESLRQSLDSKIEETIWKTLSTSAPGSDRQKMLFKSYVSSVETSQGYDKLVSVLSKKTSIAGLNLDQDLRWHTLKQLNKFPKDIESLVKAEVKNDSSDRGKKSLLAVRAVHPSLENKRKEFQKALDIIAKTTSEESFGDLRATMDNLFPRRQLSMKKEFAAAYYEALPKLEKLTDPNFIERFVDTFIPLHCEQSSNQAGHAFIAKNPKLPYQVIKNIRIALQEDERCFKIQNLISKRAKALTETPIL